MSQLDRRGNRVGASVQASAGGAPSALRRRTSNTAQVWTKLQAWACGRKTRRRFTGSAAAEIGRKEGSAAPPPEPLGFDRLGQVAHAADSLRLV